MVQSAVILLLGLAAVSALPSVPMYKKTVVGPQYNEDSKGETLSDRDQQLAQITGSTTLEEIQEAFQLVFHSSDIDQVLQDFSKATNQEDAISFLEYCIEITKTQNIQEASKVIQQTTSRDMTFVEVLELKSKLVGRDLKEFYTRLMEQCGTDDLGQAFKELGKLLDEEDFFTMLSKVSQYSDYKDVILVHDIEMSATRSKTWQDSTTKIIEATFTKNLLEAYDAMHAVTNKVDCVEIFRIIDTFDHHSWEEFLTLFTTYTRTSDFLSALKALPEATGEQNALDALMHIQQGLPDAFVTRNH